MTIALEVRSREPTHISRETEERQIEERSEAEGEGEVNQNEDDGKEEKEKEEKKESLPASPEESLRMTSWVEVENEKPSAEENGEVESGPKAEEVRDDVEEHVLLEVEVRSMEEAEMEQTRSVEKELAMMEEKWREQCAINETLKHRLADEEERFKVRHTLTRGHLHHMD